MYERGDVSRVGSDLTDRVALALAGSRRCPQAFGPRSARLPTSPAERRSQGVLEHLDLWKLASDISHRGRRRVRRRPDRLPLMGGLSMAMIDPPHPGRSIRENCLEPLGLSVTEAARVLGVARHTLSRVLNGHAAISPEMGAPAGEGRLVECRVLAATPDYLRSRAGTQGPRPDPCPTIPVAASGVRPPITGRSLGDEVASFRDQGGYRRPSRPTSRPGDRKPEPASRR